MKQLLVICGPTATGKTKLALQIAQDNEADLISADSRQVYRGMDISTGKDTPENFIFLPAGRQGQISRLQLPSAEAGGEQANIKLKQNSIGYFTDGKTRLWGMDLVDPDEEFSVTDFVRFAVPVIKTIWGDNRLPIVVGGAGLYLRALLGKLPDIYIPRNSLLRKELEKKQLHELQVELQRIDLEKFQSLNNSDANNPRRLIRAIEIASAKNDHNVPPGELFKVNADLLSIGLTAPIAVLGQRITNRVQERLQQGVVAEVEKLLTCGYSWGLPAMSALGIRQWQPYFEKIASLEEVKRKWIVDETNFAKRQLTWFRKEPGVVWFDSTNPDFKEQVIERFRKWYTKS